LLYVFVAILLFITFKGVSLIKDAHIKTRFNLPWYYQVISHDLGNNPKIKYLNYKGVVGVPDAIFKHCLLPKWIVGEVKGRRYSGTIRDREKYQLTLYLGFVNKKQIGTVSGLFLFKNAVVPFAFQRKSFNWLISNKKSAIKELKKV
jgi:hypothetical protein